MTDQLTRLTSALADRYRIERELGRGGMATVYLAQDLRHPRAVAIKVLRPELAHLLGPERFLREIATCAALQHPHILGLLDSGFLPDEATGDPTGRPYYVMPYVAGESLRDRLDRERQLPLDQALMIAREVADALAYAHTRDVVHRDIKPENILLSGGHAMVADFGIAKALTSVGGEKLTETGLALGTPYYMSPEQATGDALDGRADEYALGCVLYEMLAGTPPFQGSTGQAIMARHAVDPVPSLRTVRATIPLGVEQAITRALAKSPADRFGTTAEFAVALTQGAAGVVTTPALAAATVRHRSIISLRSGAAAVVIGLVLLVTIRSYLDDNAGPADHAITSLAVQPLKSLTGDTAQVYLAEGLTDQLLTSLAQIGALRVISLEEQGSEEANEKALRDNRIDATLGGSLQRAGNAVHITVKLVSAATHQTLWAQGYDGDLSGILNLQAEVARSVATQLRASMTVQERSQLAAVRRTVKPAAYDAHLRGSYFLDRSGSKAEYLRAIGYQLQAIELDPTYAAAYAVLSLCYAALGYQGLSPPEEAFRQARAAAIRAVDLDSLLGEAHVALAQVEFMSDWDFIAAEREYRRGLELNPGFARGYLNFMVLLVALNHSDEAIAVMNRAQEADPLSPIMLAAAARPYYNARRYDEAIAQSEKALEINPVFGRALYWRGLAYEQVPRPADAIREFEQLSAQNPISLHLAALGHAYAVGGQRGKAETVLKELKARSDTGYVSPFEFATIYAGLGDRARTLDWLEKAYQRRAPYVLLLAVDPHFDAFRADPHFRDLLRRIGLPVGS